MTDLAAEVLEHALDRHVDRRLTWTIRTVAGQQHGLIVTGTTNAPDVDRTTVAKARGATMTNRHRRRKNRPTRITCAGITPDGRAWRCELSNTALAFRSPLPASTELMTGPILRNDSSARTKSLLRRGQRLLALRHARYRVVLTRREPYPDHPNAYRVLDLLHLAQTATSSWNRDLDRTRYRAGRKS